MTVIHVNASRNSVRRAIGQLVAGITGRGGDSAAARGVQLRMSSVMLSQIQGDFITKARGGIGVDGIKWAELQPSTIAARRVGPGEKPKGIKDKGGRRPYLSHELDKVWRQIFATRKVWLMGKGLSEVEASAQAARIAWTEVKRQGGKTKLEVLGKRKVEIGRDTGRLAQSLSAGEALTRFMPGRVTVGTNVAYGIYFHYQRPLWPPGIPAKLPDAYWAPIIGACREGILEAVTSTASGGRML